MRRPQSEQQDSAEDPSGFLGPRLGIGGGTDLRPPGRVGLAGLRPASRATDPSNTQHQP